MSARPWMPLYVADYLADTRRLSAAEHGAYLLLIMEVWQTREPLPDNDRILSRIAAMSAEEWDEARPTLERFFVIDGGVWRHERVEAELLEAQGKYERRAEAGRKGGKSKPENKPRSSNASDENKQCLSNAQARLNQPQPQPQSSVDDSCVATARASSVDPAVAVIDALKTAVATHWPGVGHLPHGTDLPTARKLLATADLPLIEATINAGCQAMAARNKSPPRSLSYFSAAVADAAAAQNDPMPEGRRNDRAARTPKPGRYDDAEREILASLGISDGPAGRLDDEPGSAGGNQRDGGLKGAYRVVAGSGARR